MIVRDYSHWQSTSELQDGPRIIKSGNGTSGVDPTFKARKDSAFAYYTYVYAKTNMSVAGANSRALADGKITYLDIEGSAEDYFAKRPSHQQLLTDLAEFFNTTDRSQWYIYTGYSLYKTYFKNYSDFDGAHFWIAKYSKTKPEVRNTHVFDGWQFTSSGGDQSEWYSTWMIDTAAEYPEPTRTLYYKKPVKMTGSDVKWLQERLQIEVDGKFGPATDRAVRAFQANHNLEVDGRVGPKTREELKKL